MNSHNDPNFKQKLEDLESEIPYTPQPMREQINLPQTVKTFYNQFLIWFKDLPQAGQIVVAVAGLATGFAVLKLAVELISMAISLAVVAVVIYIGYQFFKSSQSSKS